MSAPLDAVSAQGENHVGGISPGSIMTDAFHPTLRHVPADEVDPETAQSEGMQRFAAISNSRVGSAKLWMGQTHVRPGLHSANHHHGDSETAIFVVSGTPEFVFLDGADERRIKTRPGDYVYVPPWVAHREENNDPDVEAVVVIARSTQEAIVVNLPSLHRDE